MKSNSSQTKEFLRLAYLEALKSRDLSTQNGAVIVNPAGRIIARGANNFPLGVQETEMRLQRPAKYKYVIHAEDSAILSAARFGETTLGATMYSPWAACETCAQAIINSGILKVVVHEEAIAQSHGQWPEAIKIALEMFEEAGVSYVLFSAQFGDLELRFNGNTWRP